MKLIVIFLTTFFLVVSCQTISSKAETNSEKQVADNATTENSDTKLSSIRKIDFQNFTFPWTKTFGGKEKFFTLKNGISNLADSEKLSFKSLSYVDVADEYDEQALIIIKIDDGNATYNLLYIYAIENNKPKLLGSFEFGANNVFFGTAFEAHRELVIETYHQLAGDAECCPSVIEISYYKWQKSKFISQDDPQKISNGYVERMKKERSNK